MEYPKPNYGHSQIRFKTKGKAKRTHHACKSDDGLMKLPLEKLLGFTILTR